MPPERSSPPAAADNLRYGQPIEWAAYDNPEHPAKKVRVVVASYGGTGDPEVQADPPRLDACPRCSGTPPPAATWSAPRSPGHAAAAGGFAVGAMTDQAAPVVEAYSSRGPATSCWEPSRGSQASAALPACTTRTVGTLGTDGVATTVPGFNPFYGTSAASPHVAAVAALMRQHAPCSTPAAIHDALRAGAVPLGSEPDASGAGRTDAVGAIEALAACPVTLPAPRFPWLGRVKADRVTMSLYTPDAVVGQPDELPPAGAPARRFGRDHPRAAGHQRRALPRPGDPPDARHRLPLPGAGRRGRSDHPVEPAVAAGRSSRSGASRSS